MKTTVWDTQPHVLYECNICSCLHPWNWNSDCRDDTNRYGDTQDYAEKYNVSQYDITVVEWEDRIEADSE